MAASMDHVRVRLRLPNPTEVVPSHSADIWSLVDCKSTPTIAHLHEQLQQRFFEEDSDIRLYLDGSLLPACENIHVLRDNDTISVVHSRRNLDTLNSQECGVFRSPTQIPSRPVSQRESLSSPVPPKKKQKHDTDQPLELMEIEAVPKVSPLDKKKSKKKKHKKNKTTVNDEGDNVPKLDRTTESHDKKKKKKSKKSKRTDTPDKEKCKMLSIESESSNMNKANITSDKPKSVGGNDNVSHPDKITAEEPHKNLEKSLNDEDSNQQKKKKRVRKRKRKRSLTEDPSSTIYKVSRVTGFNNKIFHLQPITTAPSTPVLMYTIVAFGGGCPITWQVQPAQNATVEEPYFCLSNGGFVTVEGAPPTLAIGSTIRCLRENPPSKKNSQGSDTRGDQNPGFGKRLLCGTKVVCDMEDKQNQRKVFDSGDEVAAAEESEIQGGNHQSQDASIPNDISASTHAEALICRKTSQTTQLRKQAGDNKTSQIFREKENEVLERESLGDLEKDLQSLPPSGYTVFTRQRNKQNSWEVTKSQQLETINTNHSIVLKNKWNSEEADGFKTLPKEKVKDYQSFPALHGAPRQGDLIAFKMLEMSENYTPEISQYKEGRVLSFDPSSQQLELELLLTNKTRPKAAGKFDLVYEDDDDHLQSTDCTEDSQLSIDLRSLMEPKLLPN